MLVVDIRQARFRSWLNQASLSASVIKVGQPSSSSYLVKFTRSFRGVNPASCPSLSTQVPLFSYLSILQFSKLARISYFLKTWIEVQKTLNNINLLHSFTIKPFNPNSLI